MTISCSDCRRNVVESSFYCRKQFTGFPLKCWTYRFRARRSIWWGWKLTVLAPRIGNDVSYVTRINHEIHFARQAQYLVKLWCAVCCSAHCKWRFICDADQSWDSFCVAGAVFGEVGVLLFVAGAALGEILIDSRSAKCCIFQYKIVFEVGRVRSPKRRVRDDDFMLGLSSDYRRIIVGMSSNRLSIGGSNSRGFRCNLELKDFVAGAVFAEVGGWHCLLCALEMKFHMRRGSNMRFILRGRRSICWGWRLTLLALRIGNDVSYEARINHEIHFAWQAQYLLRFEVDFACSAHSKWRFICDADQSWDAFCVAGAVFGEVGLSLFVAGAAFGDILGDGRSAKCFIFQYKIVSKIGRVRSPKRRVRDDDFILGSWSDYPRIVFILAEAIQGFCAEILNSELRGRRSTWWVWRVTLLAPRIGNDVSYVTRINHEIHFAWQAQYLVRFEVDFACSAHSKWRFICEADQSWDSFCVAGAVFGEGGGWLLLLRAF